MRYIAQVIWPYRLSLLFRYSRLTTADTHKFLIVYFHNAFAFVEIHLVPKTGKNSHIEKLVKIVIISDH